MRRQAASSETILARQSPARSAWPWPRAQAGCAPGWLAAARQATIISAVTKTALRFLFPGLLGAALFLYGKKQAHEAARAADLDPCAAAPVPDGEKLAAWLKAECYKRPALGFVRDKEEKRKTGPTPATAPHGRVTVYYDKQVHAWLKQDRRGKIPDGALIVKEMFDWDSGEFAGRAAMLKDKRGSYAGWFFYPGDYLAGGCIGCHASALSDLTFSDLGHIDGSAEKPHAQGQPSALALASHPGSRRQKPGRPPLLTLEAEALAVPPPSPLGLHLRDNPEFGLLFPRPGGPAKQTVLPLPDWQKARPFVAGPDGPALFLPSTNCFGCHDAQVADKSANMVLPLERSSQYLNISPYAEWSASLMGLSGRDPVFHAQLESEKAMHPEQSGPLDDTCYRCHGAAGQRQIHLDLGRAFSHDVVYAQGEHPLARYGALVRDGVTCTVCHHIAAAGLGQEKTFTGQFATGPADELWGPYADGIKAQPMKQALGITPRGGEHLRSSALCGSCHTVILPQVPAGYRGDAFADRTLGREHEQTTYLEWRNSAYQDERAPGPDARSCQGCHMPTEIDGPGEAGARPLLTKIANIEEFLPNVPSSLPASEITLVPRKPYARHSLTGINLFVMRMFSQFAGVLGVARRDPLAGEPSFLSSLNLAQREALALAQRSTARVELIGAPRLVKEGGGTLLATVRVTNRAGHKFPSGVGFRRAFLELQVLDRDGKALWASGRTSPLGVLVGPDGQALPSEFTQNPAALQPHHQRITRPEQVQIYEERTIDESGRLTTSFLSLFQRVKDNRLLPKGWAPDRRGTEFMQPLDLGGKRLYEGGRSADELTYAVPLGGIGGAPHSVQVTLYYQSIPPYYLKDRFTTAKGPETQRLYLLASGLDDSGAIQDWKLQIATTGRVAIK